MQDSIISKNRPGNIQVKDKSALKLAASAIKGICEIKTESPVNILGDLNPNQGIITQGPVNILGSINGSFVSGREVKVQGQITGGCITASKVTAHTLNETQVVADSLRVRNDVTSSHLDIGKGTVKGDSYGSVIAANSYYSGGEIANCDIRTKETHTTGLANSVVSCTDHLFAETIKNVAGTVGELHCNNVKNSRLKFNSWKDNQVA